MFRCAVIEAEKQADLKFYWHCRIFSDLKVSQKSAE